MFYKAWIPSILSIAQEAANAIMDVYRRKTYQIKSKLDNSPVTEADLRAHHIIEQGLLNLDPFLPIISEEGEMIPYEVRSQWSRFWLVDPLDGTQEFIRGTQEFTINIALIENHLPVLGVVLAPALKECYWAIQGGVAYMQRKGDLKVPIHTHYLPRSPLKIVVSPRNVNSNPAWIALAQRLGDHELSYGGSSLKMCLVAKGEFDLYPQMGSTSEWDTAAGQCILEGAGGQLVDATGQPLRYNQQRTLENPGFYAISDRYLIPFCCG